MNCTPTDAWRIESESLTCGLDAHVYELVDCVKLPGELCAHAEGAEADTAHETAFDAWLMYLWERDLLLPIEQSCNPEGLLLPWDMRGVRLRTLPPDMLGHLHYFFENCPRHTRALVTHYAFWLVRFERVHRRGTPEWTTDDVDTAEDDEPSFFRPPLLVVRRYGR